ncbi:MAG: glycosyltransferase family 2 protein [Gallionella sp.]|nr:glycosyltransferase family 2 protein [Gallionella sp.]
MPPTIAVVIPNRNDSGYLRKCLDSVLIQDVPPDQVIVVDDQSTDDSMDVIRERLSHAPGAKIIANPTCLGTMGALNEGLKYVTSEYVLFLSSNDYVEKGIFERAKFCIASAGSPGVWSAMVWAADESGNRLHIYPSPVVALSDTFFPPDKCIRLAQKFGNWFTGTTLIYRRETLQKIGGFDISYHGLGDLLAALTVASIDGAAFSSEPFGVMRQHEGGLYRRTMTNLPGLDVILKKMESTGPILSHALFTPGFCEVMKRRLRFSAIRAFGNNAWLPHARSWTGYRYKLLCIIAPYSGKFRKLQLILAFMLLRPPFDLITIVWHRYIGRLLVLSQMRNRKSG